MKKSEITYLSADGLTTIHATLWLPEGEPRAVLQIAHGMQEYIGRYEPFAVYLTEHGFAVAGNDHLGHGRSVTSEDKLGYFAKKNGNACVLKDMHTLREHMQALYPDLPYFVMGHSMGSFLMRQYIESHGEGLSGAVIMGTGTQPAATLALGKLICRLIAAFRGWEYRSSLVENIAFGSYNKKIHPQKTKHDWITKDESVVKKYESDPWCMFQFTVNGFYNMFLSIQRCQKEENVRRIPRDLPVLFASGAEDPVGNYGKGVKAAYEQCLKCGLRNVKIRLYENDRHEILNETDKKTVWQDLLSWLEDCRTKV